MLATGELERGSATVGERRKPGHFWRPAQSAPDLLCGAFHRTGALPHVHEEWQFAVTDQPVWLSIGPYRRHAAGVGELTVVHPHEVHSEVAGGDGARSWRSLFVAPALIARQFDATASTGQRMTPWFVRSVIACPDLAEQLAFLLSESERGAIAGDEFVARVLSWLTQLLRRHAAATSAVEPPRNGAPAVRVARNYLEQHHSETVPMERLVSLVNVSPSHLMRSFSRTVGLPPLSYQAQVRLAHARRLLLDGHSASWVAHECGFADQSHLTRRFKESFGLTPGSFQRQVVAGVHGDAGWLPRSA